MMYWMIILIIIIAQTIVFVGAFRQSARRKRFEREAENEWKEIIRKKKAQKHSAARKS